MTGRRARGTGGMFQIDQGTWRVDVEIPRTPGDSPGRLSRTVLGTRWEVERVLSKLRADGPPRGETFGVRLPEDLAAALRRRAESNGVATAEEIRRAVAAWLDSKP
jgi:Ribbon-helix-helix protein, copG family